MTVLLENLQSDVLNRNVKISILSCFGDIALAIGPHFEPYLETTMTVLRQAGAVEPNPVRVSMKRLWPLTDFVPYQLDYDLMDYVAQLREGILEAYTGIVTGFKNTDKSTSERMSRYKILIFDSSELAAQFRFGYFGACAEMLSRRGAIRRSYAPVLRAYW